MVAILRDTSENIGKLYEEHRDMVYKKVLRMVRDEDTASDLTQEVFVSLYDKINQYDGRSQFSTWLYRVAVNHVLDYFKGEKKYRAEPIHELHDSIDFEDTTKSAEEIVAYKIRVQTLRKAIQRLQFHERETLELYLKDFEIKEIGQILGAPIGTVKSRLNRAKKSLVDLVFV